MGGGGEMGGGRDRDGESGENLGGLIGSDFGVEIAGGVDLYEGALAAETHTADPGDADMIAKSRRRHRRFELFFDG